MKLPKDLSVRQGFSLIELVVALALLGIIVSMGAVFAVRQIEQGSLDAERDLYVSLLYESRVSALANVSGTHHGVHIAPNAFVLFEGASFESSSPDTHVVVQRHESVNVEGLDVAFAPLTAYVAGDKTISFESANAERSVTIIEIGSIDW